jgi:Acylphosphatases
MKAVDVIVTGRVQKVGFRAFTKRSALMLGVKGYVENTGDGKVHAVLEGDEHQVDKLLELLRRGPTVAQVREVKVTGVDEAGHRSFEVR